MIKNTIIGVVAVVALLVGILAYSKTPKTIIGSGGVQGQQGIKGDRGDVGPQGPRGEVGQRGPQGPAGSNGSSPVLGALSGPDLPYPYISFGGVRSWAAKTDSLVQASTTICSLQAPAATSTLSTAALRLEVGSTSAMFIEFAKSTSPAATTTRIGSTYVVAANAQATIVASSTGSVAGDATIFAPNTYFYIKAGFATVPSTPTAPVGTCLAQWTQI